MTHVDGSAAQFVRPLGDDYRAMTSVQLLAIPDGRIETVPADLAGYVFTFTKALLRNGKTRIIVEGSRPSLGGLITHSVHDAFDLDDSGKVFEIGKRDEDYCGRS